MKRSLVVALALAVLGFAAAHASGASRAGTLLGGWVQVVAYSNGDVDICPDYLIAAARRVGPPTPPDCSTGLPATGVQTAALPNQSLNESWGYLYLTGTYDTGTFAVSSQSTTDPGGPEGPSLATPPCPRPRRGWRLVLPTEAQFHLIYRYQRHHRHDVTSLEMFDNGDVATLASTHPRRARKAFLHAWPRQLCVVRSHYTMSAVRHAQRDMAGLVGAGADYGWVTGGGGSTVTESGQPATSLDVLIETPDLSDLLAKEPRGLVVLDATLHPVPAT